MRTNDSPAPEDRAPVFVYGTLRSGERNAALLRGRTAGRRPGTLRGHQLLDNETFPYLVRGDPDDPDETVTGDLIDLDPDRFVECLADLDRLEGVEWGHYVRELVAVESSAGSEPAWTYLAGPAIRHQLEHLEVIRSGDWLRR